MFNITYIVKLAFEHRKFVDRNYILNHYVKLHCTNTLSHQGPKPSIICPLPPTPHTPLVSFIAMLTPHQSHRPPCCSHNICNNTHHRASEATVPSTCNALSPSILMILPVTSFGIHSNVTSTK